MKSADRNVGEFKMEIVDGYEHHGEIMLEQGYGFITLGVVGEYGRQMLTPHQAKELARVLTAFADSQEDWIRAGGEITRAAMPIPRG